MNNRIKIGDRVVSDYGIAGKVLDIDPNLGVYVFWDNGTSAYYKANEINRA